MSENTANRIFNTVNVTLIVIAMVLCLAPFIHIIAISLSSNGPLVLRGFLFRKSCPGRRMVRCLVMAP